MLNWWSDIRVFILSVNKFYTRNIAPIINFESGSEFYLFKIVIFLFFIVFLIIRNKSEKNENIYEKRFVILILIFFCNLIIAETPYLTILMINHNSTIEYSYAPLHTKYLYASKTDL